MTDLRVSDPGRRRALAFIGMAAAAKTAAGQDLHRADPAARPLPPGLGDRQGKFDGNGDVRPWPGDTIICPLPVASPAFAEMLEINVAVTRGFRDYIAATPPASYHMTIIGGANAAQRGAGTWPACSPRDAPIATVNDALLNRLRHARFDYALPIRMKIDTRETTPLSTGIPLIPADAAQHAMLYGLRRAIARTIGSPLPARDRYRFHMTFGYLFRAMPAPVEAAFRLAWTGWRERMASRLDAIALPAPVYCTFDDMFAFQPRLVLPRSVGAREMRSRPG